MFLEYCYRTIKRYAFLQEYELWNEPNGNMATDEDVNWYYKMIEGVERILKIKHGTATLNVGATMTPSNDTENRLTSETFFDKLSNLGMYNISNRYSVHIYDYILNGKRNSLYKKVLDNHIELTDRKGGFFDIIVTEYGIPSDNNSYEENQRSIVLIQQANVNNSRELKKQLIYAFKDTSADKKDLKGNYGLLNYDYTPKPVYYALKNYLANTNGSEYIGNLNIQNGLEAHVYNKDGKPLIIAWSDNTNNTYDFTLNNMTAKDLYGKEIIPDTNGNIQITTSPVYLYNVGTNYFYQAISNVSTTKYDDFLEKFKEEISQVSGLKTSVENLKGQIQNISNNSSLNEQTAINLMKEHYKFGDTIINAYKSKTLQVEYVKLSSMLDMLDDIGDSFEDLVTVSAKTRNSNLVETKDLITTTENLINNNEDLEIIYPTKILEFSKDFHEKADYINNLEEENDIKTGLIVSKNLHAKLLASWASEFAELYIDKYIEDNSVEIEYSKTSLTNQPVTATLKTNAQITVTNNQNSKAHTFTENGEFTFEYTIKGRSFTKKATVTNIDKTPPQITGVENDGFYQDSVTPRIVDANLQEVKLYKNNNVVSNYITNSVITEDGAYKLVAKDTAGNITEISFDICRIPATVSYSATRLTSKDVVATISSNYPFRVTNNYGNKNYTFTKNGSFTFNYTIKGKTFTITATVNNIDKTSPEIKDVENGKLYIDQAVTPKVSDENLNEVKLYLNSVQVKNYKSGTKLTEEGFYKLIANDYAGNETIVNFNIIINNSKEYQVQDKKISNITYNTSQKDFMKKFSNSAGYQIERDGQVLGEKDVVATGDKLKTKAGDEYTLIVTGDINKDGNVNISDIIKLRRYLLLRNNLDEEERLAADCNLDGKPINISDLIKMRLIVLMKGAT